MRSIYVLVLIICLGLCRAAEVTVKILHTSDIHGVVMPEPGETGSWYQLGSLIGEHRKAAGRHNNILLIDTGDTCQGTLLGAMTKGEACLVPLHNLKYDVWVPGNHEMDFGLDNFCRLADKYRDLILCGNLEPIGRRGYPGCRIIQRGGARIAVIGMTASYMKNWMNEASGVECRVTMAKDEIRKMLPDILAEKPDMIILACHQAWQEGNDPRKVNEVAEIAEEFPEIDLILGAHSHRLMAGHKIGQGVWYTQPGCHAKYLGVVTARIDTDRHEVIDISSELQKVTAKTRGSSEAIIGMDAWLHRAEYLANEKLTPVMPATLSAGGRPGVDCAASELFCLAMAKAANVDVAFHSVLATKDFPAGKAVTGRDLFAFVPYENTIFTAQLTSDEICRIEAEQWEKRDVYTYCGIWGANVRIGKDGRVRLLSIGDRKIEEGKRYLVAFNSFTVAGGGRYPVLKKILARPEAQLKDTKISTREAVRKYLQGRRDWPLHPVRWIETE